MSFSDYMCFVLMQASKSDGSTSTTKKSTFTYKTPNSRRMAFGGVVRDEDGEMVDDDAAESGTSLVVQTDAPPIDYVVITEPSELFDRAVS